VVGGRVVGARDNEALGRGRRWFGLYPNGVLLELKLMSEGGGWGLHSLSVVVGGWLMVIKSIRAMGCGVAVVPTIAGSNGLVGTRGWGPWWGAFRGFWVVW